ncbi:MAG TPA: hypothetical protein VI564_04850 [Candidatus Nanoarchaeia archaeon]|nr:hypothetical protein [Candidatus Nanoarchaeia archaeon]
MKTKKFSFKVFIITLILIFVFLWVITSPFIESKEMTKKKAYSMCLKRAKECSEDILAIETELRGACSQIYQYTPDYYELLNFTKGMC